MKLSPFVFATMIFASLFYSPRINAEEIIDEPFFPVEYTEWLKIRNVCVMQDNRMYSIEGYRESKEKNSQYVVLFKVADKMFAVSLYYDGVFYVTRKNVFDSKWTRYNFTARDDYSAYFNSTQEYYWQLFGKNYKESDDCRAATKFVFYRMTSAQ